MGVRACGDLIPNCLEWKDQCLQGQVHQKSIVAFTFFCLGLGLLETFYIDRWFWDVLGLFVFLGKMGVAVVVLCGICGWKSEGI